MTAHHFGLPPDPTRKRRSSHRRMNGWFVFRAVVQFPNWIINNIRALLVAILKQASYCLSNS